MRRTLFYIVAFALIGCAKPAKQQSDVFGPEKIKTDTLYHIAALDSHLIYYDSIRYETRHFPNRYMRWISSEEYLVIVGADTMTSDEYSTRYCAPVSSVTLAQCDTIMNTHLPGFYRTAGEWALRSIIRTGYQR